MTIKVGDKVRVKNYSDYIGKVGIVFKVPDKGHYGRIAFDGWDYIAFLENDVELVEVATYMTVPKFKIGDVVYDKKGKKCLILEDRKNGVSYHCWSYENDTDVFMLEEELTRELVTEETKDE